MRQEILAIIPARGGSKGIPGKNVRPVAGKPLLAYSIEHARNAPAIARIVVTTDDPTVAAVVEQWGAEVIWRPAEISGDHATSESALLHALDYLRDTESYEPDLIVFLQATSPLRQSEDIQKAIETLLSQEADSLFSFRPVEGFLWRCAGGNFDPVNYDPTHRPFRQDLQEACVEENGSIYVLKPQVLRTHGSRLGGRIVGYRMRELDSFQVDKVSDLSLVESLLALSPREERRPDPSQIRLFVLDFDGVMTNNRVQVDQDGNEAVWCHRGDGLGIAQLKNGSIEMLVLSTEKNPVVDARCRKLGIECIQACDDKLAALQKAVQLRGLSPQEVAYIGNDVNDLGCLRWVGVPIAVADAVHAIRSAACWVTSRPGGFGAVREVTDWLLTAREKKGTDNGE